MSYFDEASLVMIPSGYKEDKIYSIKPTDGSGDLTFSRSNDTATRVGPDGLIEKVRTNVITYSEQFDNGAWVKTSGITISADSAVSPDGYTNADVITWNGSSREVAQVVAIANGVFSFYAKGSGTIYVGIAGGTQSQTIFTLTADWSRIVVPYTGTSSYVYIGNYGGATATSVTVWGAQLENGDIATDYIATTTAAVSVGPVANLPRLDYLDSSCPKLLLEPQRTNIQIYSEQFDNAAWQKRSNISVTSNAITAPDGTLSADKIAASDNNYVDYGVFDFNTSNLYTYSVFAKKGELNYVFVGNNNSFASEGVFFNLNTGEISSNPSSYSASITDYGNGWYRCSVYFATNVSYFFINPSVNGTSFTFSGQSGNGIYIWGAQAEVGAYETSYIPTLSAASTRGVDITEKTGIGSLFGASAGTIYFETTYYPETNTGSGERWVYAQGATSADYIRLWQDVTGGSKRIRALVATGGVQQVNISALATELGLSDTEPRTIKFAFAYADNDFRMYVNGNKQDDTAGTAPTITEINFNNTFQTIIPLAQALVFPTALTDSELAALTA